MSFNNLPDVFKFDAPSASLSDEFPMLIIEDDSPFEDGVHLVFDKEAQRGSCIYKRKPRHGGLEFIVRNFSEQRYGRRKFAYLDSADQELKFEQDYYSSILKVRLRDHAASYQDHNNARVNLTWDRENGNQWRANFEEYRPFPSDLDIVDISFHLTQFFKTACEAVQNKTFPDFSKLNKITGLAFCTPDDL